MNNKILILNINKMTLKDFSFPVGFAIKYPILTNPAYVPIFDSDARSVTSENAFKMGGLQPSEYTFDFTKADAIRDFAQLHNLRLHGHTLIWANDQSTPAWVKAYEGTPNAVTKLTEILQNHITTVVKHFKGVVKSWDVVNETTDPETGLFRESVWSRVLGRDFFRMAFAAAAAADPDCKLFYNDVNFETGNDNRYDLVMSLKSTLDAAGVPFHGVGFQMHTVIDRDPDDIRDRLNKYSDANFLVHISELDVLTRTSGSPYMSYTPELEERLARLYKSIFEGYLKGVAEKNRWGITMWSVSDTDNYMNQGNDIHFPMLFDHNYKPKLAYYRVLSLLNPPASNPLIFQDFEYLLDQRYDSNVIGDPTKGSTPKTWTLEGNNATARIEIGKTGLSGVQNSQNTFNYPILNVGISDYSLESEAGYIDPGTDRPRTMFMLFRYSGQNDYLAVQAQKTDTVNFWRLVKRSASQDTTLLQTSVQPKPGQIVKVVCKGTSITLYIDGVAQGTIQETQFLTSTKIGYKMRGYDDKFSSWKYISLSALPTVLDEFIATGTRANINATSASFGAVTKQWTVTGDSGFDGMEVTTVGLQAKSGSSTKYSNAILDLGVSNFKLTSRLVRTKQGNVVDRNATILIRYKDLSNFYYVLVDNSGSSSKWLLVKRVGGGTNTTLLTSDFDARDGDVVTVDANGSLIKFYVNDIFIGSVPDTVYTTQTKVGFRGRGYDDVYTAWSNIQLNY
jgi:endo-1,4-beta-xylanase